MALTQAGRRKEKTYWWLTGPGARGRLVVLTLEVGGGSAKASARARSEPRAVDHAPMPHEVECPLFRGVGLNESSHFVREQKTRKNRTQATLSKANPRRTKTNVQWPQTSRGGADTAATVTMVVGWFDVLCCVFLSTSASLATQRNDLGPSWTPNSTAPPGSLGCSTSGKRSCASVKEAVLLHAARPDRQPSALPGDELSALVHLDVDWRRRHPFSNSCLTLPQQDLHNLS